jgi:Mrp family chromosome partitioning ATPase
MSWLPYTVAPNPDPTPRSGSLTVAGRTLTVNQAAAPCTYDVSPTTVVVDKQGGTATVTVQAGSGCSWTVQSSLNWVTVTSGNGGTGSGSVTLQIAANPLAYPRAGGMVIAGDFVIVNQSNVAPAPSTPGNFRIIP